MILYGNTRSRAARESSAVFVARRCKYANTSQIPTRGNSSAGGGGRRKGGRGGGKPEGDRVHGCPEKRKPAKKTKNIEKKWRTTEHPLYGFLEYPSTTPRSLPLHKQASKHVGPEIDISLERIPTVGADSTLRRTRRDGCKANRRGKPSRTGWPTLRPTSFY